MEGKIIVEFTHRIFSSATGLLILLNAFILWKQYRSVKRVKNLAAASVLLLGLVGALGGVNVLNKLPSGLTAIDMVVALLLLAVLVRLTVQVRADNRQGFFKNPLPNLKELKQLHYPALAVFGAVYLEAAVGGFLKHSSASHTYVHPNAPIANELVTTYPAAEAVMLLHLFTAFSVVLAVFWMLVYAKKNKLFFKQSISLVLLIGAQGALGFLSIMTKLELLTTTAHMGVASLMLWIGADIAATVKVSLAASQTSNNYEPTYQAGRTVISNG